MQDNLLNKEREKMLKKLSTKGMFQIFVGSILVLWNVLMEIAIIDTSEGDDMSITIALIIFILGFIVWGALLINSGIQKRKGVKIFESYRLKLYGKEDALNINYRAIAAYMGKDEATVKKEVSLFIKLKLWEHVYGGSEAVRHNTMNIMTSQISVTCNSCHGVSQVNINDRGARCTYCNAPLSDEIHKMKNI